VVPSHALSLSLAVLLVASFSASAQSYPVKTVRLVSPLAPGGGNDALARFVAKYLTEELRQQVIVENRPGGGGLVGTEYVARAAPDGYTLLMGGTGQVVVSINYPGRIDMQRDFVPIAMVGEFASLLTVHPSFPVRTVADVIRLARAQPGKINYGSAGNGSAGHLMMEMFRTMANIDIVHIPYKGAAPALTELMAGQVTMVFNNPLGSMGHITAGRLRAVAVSSPKRLAAMPDVPTVAESGLPGFNATLFLGLFAPAAVPRDIVSVLNAATVKVVQRREVQEALEKQGMEAAGGTPEQFSARVKSDVETYRKVIRAAKVQMN